MQVIKINRKERVFCLVSTYLLYIKKSLFIVAFYASISFCFAQMSPIELNEVELSKKALPIILVDGEEYSFRNRDFFIKMVLKSRFWEDSFYVKVDLVTFNKDSLFTYEIDGKTRVFLDNVELDKTHQFKKKREIKILNEQLEEVRVMKNSIILKDESIIKERIIELHTFY